jgi:hypothetical protein
MRNQEMRMKRAIETIIKSAKEGIGTKIIVILNT